VGKAAVNLIDVAISQDLTAAIVKRERYSPEFLAYSLMTESSQQVFELQKRGATIKGIPREDLFRIPVSAPPLPEQRKIAAVLFKVQRAIELQEKFATTLGQLKAATMAKLFREGLRREPLKQTEIGEIPESWSVQRIGSLAKVGNGSTPSRSNESYWQNGYIPWITSTKIHDTIIRQADEFVTEEARRQCHLPLVPRRSIVIAITGQGKTLGNAAILDIDTCINQHLAYVRFEHPSVHPEFILFYLHSKYQYFRQVASAGGSTKGALTCRFLADMPVPLPSLDEQREIAALLRLLTKRRSIADRMKGTLSTLFRAMLQNLMTGVVRVNHLEIPEVIHAYPRE